MKDTKMHSNPKPMARTKGLLINEMNDEMIVYLLDSNESHLLNRTSARIWTLCDGTRTVEDICDVLTGEEGESVEPALVWEAVEKLSAAGLLVQKETLSAPTDLLSRREALVRVAAIAAPVILSVVAPTPAAASSTVVAPTACLACAMFNPNNTCPVQCTSTVIGKCCSANNSCNSNCVYGTSCQDCFLITAGANPAIQPSSWTAATV